MDKLFFAFNITQIALFGFGIVCFIALFFIPAGYGKMRAKGWGFAFNNKIAWFIMEVPTLVTMIVLMCVWATPENFVKIIVGLLFVLHYAHRVLIFPFLLKGKSKMPITIVLMGVFFNTVNTFLIGTWLFYMSPKEAYPVSWLYDPRFIVGTLIFLLGMAINIDSDKYIRSLRKPGDMAHYFPCKRMYKFVTSANYFGEILEWCGFALLSWSTVGLLFAFWTAANLVPRAFWINRKYRKDFSEEYERLKPKAVIPFVF